jgi:hypothetical protein
MFGRLFRAYLLGRLLRRSTHRSRRAPYGRGRHPYGYARRARGRAGFFGPFPTYTTRTRRGSRVTVGGCCLPIPLALVLAMAGALTALARRR